MYTLFRFFQKHHLFFLFLVLEGVSVLLLVRNNHIQRVSFEKATGTVAGSIYEQINVWHNYLRLYEVNEQLSEENTRLRNQLPGSFYLPDATSSVFLDSTRHRKYAYLSAEVINNSVNKQYNYITLDKGRAQHISEKMAVIGPEGIVGIVHGVSEHFSTVLPVINRHFRISAKFKKNNYYGSLMWNGRSYRYAELADIPLHVPVEMGDTLVVTGFSSSFPEGVPVGTVTQFTKKDGNFYSIEVLLFTDFRNLSHVSVVEDLMKKEQEVLEQQIPDEQ